MKKLVLLLGLIIPQFAYADIELGERFQVHEPIVATSKDEADLYIWDIRGEGTYYPSTLEVDNGKVLHIWSKPGKFQVILKTISVDWETKKVQYNSFVKEILIVSPDPTPTPPGPGPGPNPNPTPTPTGFAGKVKVALNSVSADALSHKNVVADIYESIAAEAAANPSAWDAASMMNEVKVRNLSNFPNLTVGQGWSNFWPIVAKAFVEEKLDSSDLAGHIQAFKTLSSVLRG